METLHKAISFRMIGGREDVFDPPSFGELLEEMRTELRTSVRSDRSWNAELLHPAVGEGVEDRLGGDVD